MIERLPGQDKLFHLDCHFHGRSTVLAGAGAYFAADDLPWYGIDSCHDAADLAAHARLVAEVPPGQRLAMSMGIHPEFLDLTPIDHIAALAEKSQLRAIGECGFDLFSRGRETLEAQHRAFAAMIDLALAYNVPLVLHNRKAVAEIYRHRAALQRVRALVFHSCSLAAAEIPGMLDKGLPAWFSYGTPVLWAGPRLGAAVAAVPLDRLLTETDAPCQPLRGRDCTSLDDLLLVEARLAEIKGITVAELLAAVNANARKSGLVEAW